MPLSTRVDPLLAELGMEMKEIKTQKQHTLTDHQQILNT